VHNPETAPPPRNPEAYFALVTELQEVQGVPRIAMI
jgi:hypothetical protein